MWCEAVQSGSWVGLSKFRKRCLCCFGDGKYGELSFLVYNVSSLVEIH